MDEVSTTPDITDPMTLDDEGCIAIPAGTGFGVEPDEERIATLTVDTRRVSLV